MADRPIDLKAALKLAGRLAEERDDALADLLRTRGLLPPDRLAAARKEAAASGRRLADILASREGMDAEALASLQEEVRAADYGAFAMTASSALPEEARAAAADPARVLAEFILVSPLGRGGAGEVWRAWDGRLGRWVAIKVPPPLPDARSWERIGREAQTAAKLSHPNIVPIYRIDQHQGRPYIVMRLIEGSTLGEQKLTLRRALDVVRTAALAVHHAHQQGIVHRDLKPANIMLDTGGVVWLLDFGLAYVLDSAGSITATGSVVGTPVYMSPEQARGSVEAKKPPTDIYSLGATLYELVTGRFPFIGGTPSEVVAKVIESECLAPRRVDATIPADVETVILKAMEREPSRRYPSAAALAEDLRRILEGEPIAARPPSLTYRVMKGLRKRAVSVALLGALGAGAVALLLAGTLWSGAREQGRKIEQGLADADAALRDGRHDAARESYLGVLALDASNARAREGLDRVQRAADRLRDEREARRREVQGLLERARSSLERARRVAYRADAGLDEMWDAAAEGRRLAEEAAALDPESAAARFLVGEGWNLGGWEARAEADWRRAIAMDEGYGPPRLRLGRLLVERAFLSTMLAPPAELAEAIRGAEETGREAAAHIERAAAGGRGVEEEIQRAVVDGIVALARRDWEVAGTAAESALMKFGSVEGTEDLHWIVAVATQGRPRLEALDRALAIRPKFPMAHLMRGAVFEEENRHAQAVPCYDETLRIHPRFAWAYLLRGMVRLKLKQPEAALPDLDEAIRLDPGMARAYSNRANAHYNLGHRERAMADYGEAIRLNPRLVPAFINRGMARNFNGDGEGALTDFGRAILLQPENVQARLQRGNILYRLERFEESQADYDEIVRLCDGPPPRPLGDIVLADVEVARAWNHRRVGRLAPALEAADRAVELAPGVHPPFYIRGLVHRDAGRRAAAVPDLRRALELAPEDWPFRARALEILRELGAGEKPSEH